jgi:hypothetical protein
MNSLYLRSHNVKHMKAAIHGSGSTPHHAARGTNLSYAQVADHVKPQTMVAIQNTPRPRADGRGKKGVDGQGLKPNILRTAQT